MIIDLRIGNHKILLQNVMVSKAMSNTNRFLQKCDFNNYWTVRRFEIQTPAINTFSLSGHTIRLRDVSVGSNITGGHYFLI